MRRGLRAAWWAAAAAAVAVAPGTGWLFSSSASDDDAGRAGRQGVQVDDAAMLLGSSVRGVPLRDEARFTGIKMSCDGGAREVPLEAVNDDFCDCVDGSDEPGTSACAGRGQSAFFCANENYRGEFIPSSRVFDGVCDCCDGSDEPTGHCRNTCVEDGIEYRANMERDLAARSAGLAKREEYASLAREGLSTNSAQRAEAIEKELSLKREQLEAIKATIPDLEAAEQAHHKEQERAMAAKRIEALKLDQLDRGQLERLVVDLVVEGGTSRKLVKLVRHALKGSTARVEVGVDGSMSEAAAYDEDEEGEVADDYANPEHAEPSDPADPRWLDVDDSEGDGEIGEEAQALQKAEGERDALQSAIRALEAEKSALGEEEGRDYGPDGVWWPLRNQCFSFRADGYNYEMCPFQKASQDHINLGKWGGFAEGSNYRTLKFTDGQKCWNGPHRTMTVTASCGAEEAILSVGEPSTCEYTMEFVTPAAC